MRSAPCFTLLLASLSFSVLPTVWAQSASPQAAGYVTSLGPAGSFAVSGKQILVVPATILTRKTGEDVTTVAPLGPLFLGEEMDVYGHFSKHVGAIEATRIVVYAAVPGLVHGTAIIEAVPAAGSSGDRIFRADGYLLQITPKSTLYFTAPLKSVDDLTTNLWVTYKGLQQNDGTVSLQTATFSANTVRHTEDSLREKNEYDPAAVDPATKQGAVSKYVIGIKAQRIPPYDDPAMQSRVTRMGQGLVPAFQRALANDDPTKIDFRFQVIDIKNRHDAWSLPSGIILVPRTVVERMQNDAQLATVLADNVAEVLEKQNLRKVPAAHAMTAARIVGYAGGVVVPGLGIATDLAMGGVAAHLVALELQQSGRVSLFLLHDAGYDITQAPLAWWLLAPNKPKPLGKVSLPPRAANLYMALGTTWQQTLLTAAP